MEQQIIEFILSMKWLWLIAIILLYKTIKRIFIYLAARIELQETSIINEIKYDEKEIMDHLDYIINETIQEYILLNINPNETHYINSKTEQEILKYLQDEIPKRMSATLINKLSFIYDNNFIGEFIGRRIYIATANFVLDFNITSEKK